MYNAKTLREEVIRPTLERIEAGHPRIKYRPEVEDLLVMIAAHESHLGTYRRQVGGGPARGIYQIEIPTHEDLFDNYLKYRPRHLEIVSGFFHKENDPVWSLEHDDAYSTAVARFLLWRKSEPIPSREEFAFKHRLSELEYLEALAQYAKTHWNTDDGAATPEKYLEDYLRLTREGVA